jgi:hypothetical protein
MINIFPEKYKMEPKPCAASYAAWGYKVEICVKELFYKFKQR